MQLTTATELLHTWNWDGMILKLLVSICKWFFYLWTLIDYVLQFSSS